MDSPADRYNNFISRSGAGFDAAGRPVYGGSGHMYMGPGEFARTQDVHRQLQEDMEATESDKDRQIRLLLDRLAQASNAGKASLPVYPIRATAQQG
jgi:hypothetical protein